MDDEKMGVDIIILQIRAEPGTGDDVAETIGNSASNTQHVRAVECLAIDRDGSAP